MDNVLGVDEQPVHVKYDSPDRWESGARIRVDALSLSRERKVGTLSQARPWSANGSQIDERPLNVRIRCSLLTCMDFRHEKKKWAGAPGCPFRRLGSRRKLHGNHKRGVRHVQRTALFFESLSKLGA